MKVSYELKQGYIDVWNEESEEWDRYIKIEKKSVVEEEKKIPEKLDVINWDKCIHGVTHKEKELAIEINKTQELLNQVLDYLKSKGE